MAEPRKQAFCHRHSWPRPSNPPRKDPSVPRDLHAGTAHPTLARHPLHRPASAPVGSSVPPHPGQRHSLGSVPTLISFLFPLEDMPAISASLRLEGLGTARVKPPWGLPSLRGHTPSTTPAHMRWEPGSAARGSQQVLLAQHTMAAVLSFLLGTAQLTLAPLVSSAEHN